MFYRRMTFQVLLATFLSIYISIAAYTVLLPMLFILDAAETADFWRRMFLVVNTVGPLATALVYLFYRPVAAVLRSLEEGKAADAAMISRAQRSFRSVEGFLFMVGVLAYLLGALLNLLLALGSGAALDPRYWLFRFILAISFGLLNGMVSARMVNLAWIGAKHRLGITQLGEKRQHSTTLRKLGLPIALLLLVVLVFSILAILYYGYQVEAGVASFSGGALSRHFIGFGLLLGLVATVVLLALLVENQAHIRHVQEQIFKLSDGTMDLTKRIFIVSFDDMGYMTDGVNRILDHLHLSFRAIWKSEDEVEQTGKQTQSLVERSRQEAKRISTLIETLEDSEKVEVDVITAVASDFESLITAINEAIAKSREQSAFIEEVSQSMRAMTQSFQTVSSMAVEAAERFQRLSGDIQNGEQGVGQLVAANRDMVGATSKIREMAALIMDISDRSNLLAMNASIEAAHAGAAGKGFAVVAGEVRKLSENTAKAAKDIDAFVADILDKNRAVDELNTRIAAVFSALVGELAATSSAMTEISDAASKESRVAEESLEEIKQLLSLTAEMNHNADNISQIRTVLTTALDKLSKVIDQTTDVNKNMISGMDVIMDLFNQLNNSFEGTFTCIETLSAILGRYEV